MVKKQYKPNYGQMLNKEENNMTGYNINFPSANHKEYIELIYNYCAKNNLSLILKGSLAKGTASQFSDIDLIITGNIADKNVDEIITLYDVPTMTNFTENPQGILILVYTDTISVDLDIRDTISSEDLTGSIVLVSHDDNLILNDSNVIRKKINSKYMPNRPEWYKTLRLIHRGLIKFLSGKKESAYELLSEIREKMDILGMGGVVYSNSFDLDIKAVYREICKYYEVDKKIMDLFEALFKALYHL